MVATVAAASRCVNSRRMCSCQRAMSRCSSGVNDASIVGSFRSWRISPAAERDVVLDRGKRVVEMVQQPLPLLEFGRSPESDFVVLDRVPPDQEQEAVVVLHAAPELVSPVA